MTAVPATRSGPPQPAPPLTSGLVGSLTSERFARVDDRGTVSFDGTAVRLGWWIGADDRWHRPEDEVAVRQHRIDRAPAYETAMRIPSGDAVARVWAVGAPGEPIIIEIENCSPAPMVVALVLHHAPSDADRDTDGRAVRLDRGTELVMGRPAHTRVRAADLGALAASLEGGDPSGGSGPYLALLAPVAHRTMIRAAVFLDARSRADLDLVAVPDAQAAGRGWQTVASTGMRVVVTDPAQQEAIDRALVDVLLGAATADAEIFGALEDWGFDDQARRAWRQLGWNARRRARQRREPTPHTPAAVLRAARDSVVVERDDGTVELLAVPPTPGAPVEVHDAPVRGGSLSFALRWHGDRAALLWDVKASRPVRLVAPSLDPAWSTLLPSGEALLAGSGASTQ